MGMALVRFTMKQPHIYTPYVDKQNKLYSLCYKANMDIESGGEVREE